MILAAAGSPSPGATLDPRASATRFGLSYAGRHKSLPVARGATEGRSHGQDHGVGAEAAEYGRGRTEPPIMRPERVQDRSEMHVTA
jgi:hypothetical protein